MKSSQNLTEKEANNTGTFQSQIICGDALDVLIQLPDGIVQVCITSPPYY